MTPAQVRRLLQEAAQDSKRLAVHETLRDSPREYLRLMFFVLNASAHRHKLHVEIGIHTRFGPKGVGLVRIKTSAGAVTLDASWTPQTFECRALKFSRGEVSAKSNAAAFFIDQIVKALPPATSTAQDVTTVAPPPI